MTDGYLLNLRTFREVRDDKAQALKPLEEAAEVFGAWQELDSMRRSPFFSAWRDMRDDLIDECLDTVQATVNLLAAVGATQGEVGDKIVFDVVTNEGYAVGAAARHPLNGAAYRIDYILDGFEGLAQKYVAMAISKEGE